MRFLAPEISAIAFFVVTGWFALWPLRARLGPFGYHVSALPLGLLAAPLAGGVSSLTGRPLDIGSALIGAVLLVAAMWAIARLALGAEPGPVCRVSVRSFAVAGGAVGLLSTALGLVRYTVSNNDSFMSYWPLAVQLNRDGALTARMVATRSALLPSVGAVHAAFGSDWAYVIYPLLAVTLVAWLALTLTEGPLKGAGRRVSVLITAGAVTFLALEPSFLFHSFFVHSHMASALYLFMSLTCLWMAGQGDRGGVGGGTSDAFLILAGAFTAGLALGRPDGLAYQFVPIAGAIAVLSASGARARSVVAFYAPLCFVVLGTYAVAYSQLGFWESTKLDGVTTLMILGMMAFSAAVPWAARAVERFVPWRLSGERLLVVLVGAATALTALVFVLTWETARAALATACINLFGGAGGYQYLWYAVAALLVISVFTGDASGEGSRIRSMFLVIALFFLIAAVVHGTSHEGRIGVGDSLNRVVFHVLPVVVWYVAAVVARILGRARYEADVRP